jgi:hypothetical protein
MSIPEDNDEFYQLKTKEKESILNKKSLRSRRGGKENCTSCKKVK